MRRKISNFFGLLKKGGLDRVLDALAWSVPRWLFFYNHSILIVTEKPNLACCGSHEYNIRDVGFDDVETLESGNFTEANVAPRLKAGDRGVLVEKDGNIDAIVWGGRGRKFLRLSGVVFDPGADGFFLYGAYTRCQARNQGLFYLVVDYIWKQYLNDGVRKVWGMVSATNTPWLNKLIEEMNFSRAGETFYLKVFFLNVCFYKNWPMPTKKIRVFFRIPPDNLNEV